MNFVSEPHLVLKGHRSIVNQVRFNPQNFIIASSGVEKVVKVIIKTISFSEIRSLNYFWIFYG